MIARARCVLSGAVAIATIGCGQDAIEQPPGCVNGTEPARSTFTRDDVRIGGAVIVSLRAQQRAPWRELWVDRERLAAVKLPVVVPAGGTLTLSVPPEARGTFALYYDVSAERPASVGEGAKTVRLSACHGAYPSVGFPGQLLVARPVCRMPLDYRYGAARGRLELSFGAACATGSDRRGRPGTRTRTR